MQQSTLLAPSPSLLSPPAPLRVFKPKRFLVTPSAADTAFGRQAMQRAQAMGIELNLLKNDRIQLPTFADERQAYREAKQTLALVTAPAGQMRLEPIPPSADYQFHLAKGCPAHCQYCYLAGSLQGPPITRVYANLDAILENTSRYRTPGRRTTFEASCYTDPLAIEPITGSVSEAILYFGQHEGQELRFTSKFASVGPLLGLAHNGNTRVRMSLNTPQVARYFEAGTDTPAQRILALQQLAQAGYKIGIVLAPLMVYEGWKLEYAQLFKHLGEALATAGDVELEFITHRFTEKSREVLLSWYPATKLDMDTTNRTRKFGKFGAPKYVFTPQQMAEIRRFVEVQAALNMPQAIVKYFT